MIAIQFSTAHFQIPTNPWKPAGRNYSPLSGSAGVLARRARRLAGHMSPVFCFASQRAALPLRRSPGQVITVNLETLKLVKAVPPVEM